MSAPFAAALVVAVLCALITGLITDPLLRSLPEPAADVPGADVKPAYRSLLGARFLTCCSALSAAAVLASWTRLPLHQQPLWLVLAVLGVLIAAIDAATTWIPKRLTHLGWLAMGLAAVGSRALGAGWDDLGRAVAGAGISWLLYFALSLPRGGLGFADVRFAPLIGAATAAGSWTLLWWGLLLGALVGGCYGLSRLLRRRRGPLPYAPSMLLGAYLAVVLQQSAGLG